MRNELLVTLVNSILGPGKPTSRGNLSYYCPFHDQAVPSRKLEVNFNEGSPNYGYWGCWVCKKDAEGKNLLNLFKKAKTPSNKIHELKKILKDRMPQSYIKVQDEEEIELPKEYIPFFEGKGLMKTRVSNYLKQRGLTREDIIKYNLGYCVTGRYAQRIIFPSYGADGSLNYFISRSINPLETFKYKGPKSARDIIMYEMFINWDLPLILCEGPMDAISIKRNSIPLMGNDPQPELLKRIIYSNVKEIFLALDADMLKKSIKFAQELISQGKEVYLLELDKDDPSDLGFEEFTKLAQSSVPLTPYLIMDKKLSMI